jgi:flagellar basal-body rod modification protein FlgD
VKVEVLDSAGNVLHAEAPTNRTAGDHAFSWNGKDLSGTQLPNGGTYTLRVTATDANGATLATTNYVQGVVTGVTQANGATSITVNGGPVDWSKVVSVVQPTQAATATTPTTPAAA